MILSTLTDAQLEAVIAVIEAESDCEEFPLDNAVLVHRVLNHIKAIFEVELEDSERLRS